MSKTKLKTCPKEQMTGGSVKVIGTKISIPCARVEWALRLKGVEYEYIHEDLKNKSPLLLSLNPVHKKVPVLVHDDKPLPESLVILEYIDETWKENPLLPEDPYERAMARFWAKFVDEKCVYGAIVACNAEGEEKEKAIENILDHLALLEKQIEGKKFFGGERIGYLDLAIGWIPLWLGVMEEAGEMKLLDAQKFPRLHEWSIRFIEIPAIKEPLPPRETVLQFSRAYVSYVRSLFGNAAN